ncbi:MAG: M48 family metallopeptidase [Alphaproteobacteria bacterium]
MIEDLVTVKRSKRARRVALRLDPTERVINLVIPEHMPLHKAYKFAQDHEEWVKDTLSKLASPLPFKDGTHLPIFGDTVRLSIHTDSTLKRTKITQHDDVLEVQTYMDEPTNRITAHIKKIAQAGLADMATDKADMINKSISTVTVRDTKSRWGSCSHKRELSFSWRLIFAPYDAIDYVVAHEVAHLIHMDHSKDFWTLCRSLSCNYVEGKFWMKNHGNELMRYGKND